MYLWPGYTELRDSPMPGPQHLLLALALGAGVFAVWIRLDFPPWVIGESEGFDPRNETGRLLIGLAFVRLFGATLVVPVMEELFWRSFILRWLEHPRFKGVHPSAVGVVPLLISSALFATEHHLWLAGFLAGLA